MVLGSRGEKVVAEHDSLRRWYERQGFRANELRRFDHLPFLVLFLSAPA